LDARLVRFGILNRKNRRVELKLKFSAVHVGYVVGNYIHRQDAVCGIKLLQVNASGVLSKDYRRCYQQRYDCRH
jgi:hypothetical protein